MSVDFIGNYLDSKKCMACEIATGNYVPPGGMVFHSDDFVVHQDPYVAIAGFFIISPRRHVFSIDELTVIEQSSLGHIITVTEQLVKKVTGVEFVTIIQEEKIKEGHLHIWVFPWHDYIIKKHGYGLDKLRKIIEYYKTDLTYSDESISAVESARKIYFETRVAMPQKIFRGQYLCDQDFSGQDLSNADFEGAILKRCNFDSCDLSFANFGDADLYRVTFKNATLYTTVFKGADLTRADFRDAHLYGIKIFDADLTHVIFDDVVREEREKNYEKAEDIYNTLKRAFAENGNKEESAKYYYKQCVAQRKRKSIVPRFFDWFFRDVLTGYGERLFSCVIISSAIIFAFSILYFICNGMSNYWGSFLCSLSLFFGFEPAGIHAYLPHLESVFLVEQILGYVLIALALISLARKIVKD